VASPAINPINLLFNLGQLGLQLLQHLFRDRFPSNHHLPVALVVTCDAPLLDRFERPLLLRQDTLVAINTLHCIQLVARPLLDAHASLSLDELSDIRMTIFTFDDLDLPAVMASGTNFHEGFAVLFAGSVAVQTFESIAFDVGPVGKFDIVKRNGPSLDSNMAETGTGHSCLKFLGFVIFVDDCQGALRPIARRIQELEGIFDIVNPFAQEDKTVIVPSFVEKVLGFFQGGCASVGPLELIQRFLNVKNPLVALALGSGEERFPLLQGLIESLTVAVDAGLTDRPFDIFRGMKCGLTFLPSPMAGNAVHIRCKHEAGGIWDTDPSGPAV